MGFKEARRVLFDFSEMIQLYLAVAVAVIGMMTGMAAWNSGVLPTGGPWPDWGTFAIIMALALLSVLTSGVTLFRGASTREKLQENNDLLKEIVAGQKEIVAGQKEIVAGQKEIVAGQKEIIRLLKAYAPAGAAAAGAQPPSTAAGRGGRGGEGRIDALEGEVGRLRAEIEALKGGPGSIRR